METELITQDEDIMVLTPRRAVAPGQIIIAPLQDIVVLEQVPDTLLQKMMQIANKMSSLLFETLKCHGTNILIQNGVSAGQINKFSINVIPRFENDDVLLEWEPKQVKSEQLDSAMMSISAVDKKEEDEKFKQQQKAKAETKKVETIKDAPEVKDKENYLTKSLDRLP